MTGDEDFLDLERLALIAGGHTAFQLLWAGVQLGLFQRLSREPGLTQADLAGRLGLAEKPARILLVGLTALGLIIRKEGAYQNAILTERLLVSGEGSSIAPVLGWQAHIVYPGLQDFLDSLKHNTNIGLERFPGPGQNLYERLTAHPKLESLFQEAMSALSDQAIPHLVEAVDFSAYSHLVDVGGGDGSNAIALARHYPHLRVTVFDSPSVCQIAEQQITAAGLQGQVDAQFGEMFQDPFPNGVDAILFAHIFTIWSQEENRQLLEKAHAVLPEGGSVLIFNMMAHDDDQGPLSTALGSPYFLAIATGRGMLYAWKDYEASLRQAGFDRIQRVEGLPLDHGLLIGTK